MNLRHLFFGHLCRAIPPGTVLRVFGHPTSPLYRSRSYPTISLLDSERSEKAIISVYDVVFYFLFYSVNVLADRHNARFSCAFSVTGQKCFSLVFYLPQRLIFSISTGNYLRFFGFCTELFYTIF